MGRVYSSLLLCYLCLGCPVALSQVPPVAPLSTPPDPQDDRSPLVLLPVGITVNKRNVIPGLLVRGAEDGSQAVDFDRWLIPWNQVQTALNLSLTPLEEGNSELGTESPGTGRVEVRSPFFVTQIDLATLTVDADLGEVISIAQLKDWFPLEVSFDIIEYTIAFDLGQARRGGSVPDDRPIILEGLPQYSPQSLALSAVEQRLNLAGRFDQRNTPTGELQGVGTALEGSWYAKINQRNWQDSRTWVLSEAQYLKETPGIDYVLGSQPPFWSNRGGDFWGVTTLQRWGFTPPASQGQGFNPRQRLQTRQVQQTIVGEADPGTLVQLVRGFNDRVIAEILVDSSGLFRFERVPIERQGGRLRLLLFPEGRLTVDPEVREVNFTILTGQLPVGGLATTLSLGLARQSRSTPHFIGKFTDVQGGVGLRWGAAESTTVGLGLARDQTWRGLGELFWQPYPLPLEFSGNVLTPGEDGKLEVDASLSLEPGYGISLRLSRDRFLERANLNWRIIPWLQVQGNYTTQGDYEVASQTNLRYRGLFSSLQLGINEEQDLRWNLRSRWGSLNLSHRGNESGTSSELLYALSGDRFQQSGQSLFLNYDSQARNSDRLLTATWRYRSQKRTADSSLGWEVELGRGWGTQGEGWLATAQTSIIPGLLLRGRYQGISLTSPDPQYRLEIVSSLNLEGGLFAGDRQSAEFRNQGGIALQPFFDRNGNGHKDPQERIYTDNTDLLFILNNEPVNRTNPEIQRDRVLLRLPPGFYRLDLDPAGYPLDWRPTQTAFALKVTAGSYTQVQIPLILSYSVLGIVTDAQGNALSGVRVEAQNEENTVFSIANGAGVFVLEGLTLGRYQLRVNGETPTPSVLELTDTTPGFQELNLKTHSSGN